jgi:hypothetical protein
MKIKKSKKRNFVSKQAHKTQSEDRQSKDRQTDRQTIRLLGEGEERGTRDKMKLVPNGPSENQGQKNPKKGSKDGKFWEQNCTNMHTVRVAAQQQQAEACLADG